MTITEKYKRAIAEFNGELIKPYQDQGVRWMIAREHDFTPGGILCDEMGLGKTAQTICTILSDSKHTNTLILCPKSVIDQWVAEIYRFAPQLKGHVLVYGGADRTQKPEDLAKYRIVVGSLGMAITRKYMTETTLHKVKWHRLVLDEAHDIRNSNSKSYKSLFGIPARIRWCLTGTPVYNKMKDFMNLMKWIGVRQLTVSQDFPSCVDRYVLRRTKDEIGTKLPDCIVKNITIRLEGKEAELYKRAFDRARHLIDVARRNTTNIYAYYAEVFTQWLRCRQALTCPSAYTEAIDNEVWKHGCKKMDTVVDMVKSHPLEKTLIFCNFRKEMELYRENIKGRNIYHIDGSCSQDQRKASIEAFRNDTGGAVFLIQIKSGGVGLNLQEATRIYITSPTWSPATEIQAIGRSHRTGQTREVKVYRMITEDVDDDCRSVEDALISLQEHKTAEFKIIMPNIGEMGKIPTMGKINSQAMNQIFMTKTEHDNLEETRRQWGVA